MKWTATTGNPVESSPAVANGLVYVGSTDGWFYVLDAGMGTLVQKLELDGDIIGSPAVAKGCLVIATIKGTIYCLGE